MPITNKGVISNYYVIKFATGQWFYPGTPVSSTNKIDLHDITEILLKVSLNSITLTLTSFFLVYFICN